MPHVQPPAMHRHAHTLFWEIGRVSDQANMSFGLSLTPPHPTPCATATPLSLHLGSHEVQTGFALTVQQTGPKS